jgi:hypothetical protein
MGIGRAFQARDAGSIPVTRSTVLRDERDVDGYGRYACSTRWIARAHTGQNTWFARI